MRVIRNKSRYIINYFATTCHVNCCFFSLVLIFFLPFSHYHDLSTELQVFLTPYLYVKKHAFHPDCFAPICRTCWGRCLQALCHIFSIAFPCFLLFCTTLFRLKELRQTRNSSLFLQILERAARHRITNTAFFRPNDPRHFFWHFLTADLADLPYSCFEKAIWTAV